jgi:hypothetical protein
VTPHGGTVTTELQGRGVLLSLGGPCWISGVIQSDSHKYSTAKGSEYKRDGCPLFVTFANII